MAEQSDAFDELCRRLAVCGRCNGHGYLINEWDHMIPDRVTCLECNGTGLDPERVEMLKAFERDVIQRCARVCQTRADDLETMNRRPSNETRASMLEARLCGLMIMRLTACAAAIDGLAAKPAGWV